jgi:muconolactone delta-isomerase
MEYLVTMTTHVPDGTPAEAVDAPERPGAPVVSETTRRRRG